jgi:glyceraldehyde-3-phosphate dehydrogenase (NADP+)
MASSAPASQAFDHLYLDEEKRKEAGFVAPPSIDAKLLLVNGELVEWTGPFAEVHSPIIDRATGKPVVLGRMPMQDADAAIKAVDAAAKAYDHGRGAWPRAQVSERIAAMEKFIKGLAAIRKDVINLLLWEICKVLPDAEKEVDRTIAYVKDTIKELKSMHNRESTFTSEAGIVAQIRRAPLGVVLCLGPFNYPFNETYTTLIPALLMGNTVVMKLPRVGVLCHIPTLKLFKECFPPGVVNVVSGSGRETMPAIMKSGKIDVLAFIGTSQAADHLQKDHPKPHRLRVCLGLEAKNPAIIMPDADIAVAAEECALGTLSFNGQRCTALKILLVHSQIADKFLEAFVKKVDSLRMGLPWQTDVKITPLPEEGKPGYLTEVIKDAESKGAKIINPRGGKVDRTFVAPTIVYPVNKSMRCFHEEQFGPLIPIATFDKLDDIFQYLADSSYGQQASVFTKDPSSCSQLIDVLVNQVSRVNLNAQCQRGPDSFPFTGRKDSAYGTLSVYDALRVFSLRSLVATKQTPANEELVNQILSARSSSFLRLDYVF